MKRPYLCLLLLFVAPVLVFFAPFYTSVSFLVFPFLFLYPSEWSFWRVLFLFEFISFYDCWIFLLLRFYYLFLNKEEGRVDFFRIIVLQYRNSKWVDCWNVCVHKVWSRKSRPDIPTQFTKPSYSHFTFANMEGNYRFYSSPFAKLATARSRPRPRRSYGGRHKSHRFLPSSSPIRRLSHPSRPLFPIVGGGYDPWIHWVAANDSLKLPAVICGLGNLLRVIIPSWKVLLFDFLLILINCLL